MPYWTERQSDSLMEILDTQKQLHIECPSTADVRTTGALNNCGTCILPRSRSSSCQPSFHWS